MSIMNESLGVIAKTRLGAVVGGLGWHPLSETTVWNRSSKVRQIARRNHANSWVGVQCSKQTSLGLLSSVQAELLENRLVVHSFAALLADQYRGENLIFIGRFADETTLEDTSLVVLEAGVPVLDRILPLQAAELLMRQYLEVADLQGLTYHLVGANVDIDIDCDNIKIHDVLLRLGKSSRLSSVPANPQLFALAGIVALFAPLVYLQWFHEDETQVQLAKIQAAQRKANSNDQTPQYLAALNAQSIALGHDGPGLQANIAKLGSLRVVRSGWVIKRIECGRSDCKLFWSSEGGYTMDLAQSLGEEAQSLTTVSAQEVTQFYLQNDVISTPLPSMPDLPLQAEVKRQLFDQEQIWRKAGLQFDIDREGKLWPEGFAVVREDARVYRFRFSLRGGPDLIEDFVNHYGSAVIWERLVIKLDPFSSSLPLDYEIEGAWYAKQ